MNKRMKTENEKFVQREIEKCSDEDGAKLATKTRRVSDRYVVTTQKLKDMYPIYTLGDVPFTFMGRVDGRSVLLLSAPCPAFA